MHEEKACVFKGGFLGSNGSAFSDSNGLELESDANERDRN